jgi:hypothetical protein
MIAARASEEPRRAGTRARVDLRRSHGSVRGEEFLAGLAALTPGRSTHLRRHNGALYKIRSRPRSTKARSDRLRASWSRTSATVSTPRRCVAR